MMAISQSPKKNALIERWDGARAWEDACGVPSRADRPLSPVTRASSLQKVIIERRQGAKSFAERARRATPRGVRALGRGRWKATRQRCGFGFRLGRRIQPANSPEQALTGDEEIGVTIALRLAAQPGGSAIESLLARM